MVNFQQTYMGFYFETFLLVFCHFRKPCGKFSVSIPYGTFFLNLVVDLPYRKVPVM